MYEVYDIHDIYVWCGATCMVYEVYDIYDVYVYMVRMSWVSRFYILRSRFIYMYYYYISACMTCISVYIHTIICCSYDIYIYYCCMLGALACTSE